MEFFASTFPSSTKFYTYYTNFVEMITDVTIYIVIFSCII